MLDAKVHEQLLVHTDKELEVLENKPDFSPVFFKRLEGDFYRDRHMLIEKHTRFIAVPMHSHDFIELVYVYSGKMRQVVNGKSVELKAGELLLLNQYAQHEIEVTGEDDIIINFIIEADYIARLISLFDDENLITKFILSSINGKNKSGEHVHFKVSHDKDIQK